MIDSPNNNFKIPTPLLEQIKSGDVILFLVEGF